jgi:periplasmic copper chaperone A
MQKLIYISFIILTNIYSGKVFAINIDTINPWIRATVSEQSVSGGFLSLKTDKNLVLTNLKVDKKIADSAELHSMKMHGNKMAMSKVNNIQIPANTVVNLTGDYHIMLFGIKQKLVSDKTNPNYIPIQLIFINPEDKNNKANKTIQVIKLVNFKINPINYSDYSAR